MNLKYDQVTTIDPTWLVESGIAYAMDARWADKKYYEYELRSATEEQRRNQVFDCMYWKWRECNKTFKRDVKKNGIVTPVTLKYENGILAVWNGHHRLALAYNLGIPLPVFIAKDTNPWDAPSDNSPILSHSWDD
jgi:hypothetical protein